MHTILILLKYMYCWNICIFDSVLGYLVWTIVISRPIYLVCLKFVKILLNTMNNICLFKLSSHYTVNIFIDNSSYSFFNYLLFNFKYSPIYVLITSFIYSNIKWKKSYQLKKSYQFSTMVIFILFHLQTFFPCLEFLQTLCLKRDI